MKQTLFVLGLASFVAVILAFSLGQNVESQSSRVEIYTADDIDSMFITHQADIQALETQVVDLEAQIEEQNTYSVSLDERITVLETVEVETPTSLYLPWYSFEMRQKAVELATTYTNMSFLFTVNPASGPGTSTRADIQTNIDDIRAVNNNTIFLGYVYTGYGTRPVEEIKTDVDAYVSFYPDLDGIMWDETSNDITHLAFYEEITDYARSQGLDYIRANPGLGVPESFLSLFDVVSIVESDSLPTEGELQTLTFDGKYPKEQFNVIVHSQNILNAAWFDMADDYVGSIYITDQIMPNPYSNTATYLDEEIALLNR